MGGTYDGPADQIDRFGRLPTMEASGAEEDI